MDMDVINSTFFALQRWSLGLFKKIQLGAVVQSLDVLLYTAIVLKLVEDVIR